MSPTEKTNKAVYIRLDFKNLGNTLIINTNNFHGVKKYLLNFMALFKICRMCFTKLFFLNTAGIFSYMLQGIFYLKHRPYQLDWDAAFMLRMEPLAGFFFFF